MSVAIILQSTLGFNVQHYTFRNATLVQALHDPFSAVALRGRTDMRVHNLVKALVPPRLFLPTIRSHSQHTLYPSFVTDAHTDKLLSRIPIESPVSFPPLLPELGTLLGECWNES